MLLVMPFEAGRWSGAGEYFRACRFDLMAFEVLYFAFVLHGCRAGFRKCLDCGACRCWDHVALVEAILAGFEFADH